VNTDDHCEAFEEAVMKLSEPLIVTQRNSHPLTHNSIVSEKQSCSFTDKKLLSLLMDSIKSFICHQMPQIGGFVCFAKAVSAPSRMRHRFDCLHVDIILCGHY
jgi:hypothetical protein